MDGYIPVYVPEAYHPEILARLLDLMKGTEASETASGPIPVSPAEDETGVSGWNADVLWDVYLGVNENARKLLHVLAENVGRRVNMNDLATRLDLSEAEVRGALSSVTKHCKKHDLSWPFECDPDARTGRYSYEMDAATVAMLHEVQKRWSDVFPDHPLWP